MWLVKCMKVHFTRAKWLQGSNARSELSRPKHLVNFSLLPHLSPWISSLVELHSKRKCRMRYGYFCYYLIVLSSRWTFLSACHLQGIFYYFLGGKNDLKAGYILYWVPRWILQIPICQGNFEGFPDLNPFSLDTCINTFKKRCSENS